MKIIDLRSDTVTQPTEEMREAMKSAIVGDDCYGEDPTVNALESLAAKKMGKEDALFVTSGTMSNLVALLTHTQPGDEAIVEAGSHILNSEVGGISALAGVIPKAIKGNGGQMEPGKVEMAIKPDRQMFPKTSLICIENTHNTSGGRVIPVSNLKEIYRIAKKYNLTVHMDGARIFNASIALNIDVKELSSYADSVGFCLSKGLGAPVGSVLTGSKDFIQRARKKRRMLGGGMRQAGVIAAAGIVALEKMVDRLIEDHKNARLLAQGIATIKAIEINPELVETNIIIFDIKSLGINTIEFQKRLSERGVKCTYTGPTTVRMVTHKDISKDDIPITIDAVREVVKELGC